MVGWVGLSLLTFYSGGTSLLVHHWPKELLIWHCTVLSLGQIAPVNYDYIVTNSINTLLTGSRCISNVSKNLGHFPLLQHAHPPLTMALWSCGPSTFQL